MFPDMITPFAHYYTGAVVQAPIFGGIALSTPHMESQRKLSRIKRAADTWLFFDGLWADIGWGFPVWRHPNQTANFVYADGHAEALSVGDVDGKLVNAGGADYYIMHDKRSTIDANR